MDTAKLRVVEVNRDAWSERCLVAWIGCARPNEELRRKDMRFLVDIGSFGLTSYPGWGVLCRKDSVTKVSGGDALVSQGQEESFPSGHIVDRRPVRLVVERIAGHYLALWTAKEHGSEMR